MNRYLTRRTKSSYRVNFPSIGSRFLLFFLCCIITESVWHPRSFGSEPSSENTRTQSDSSWQWFSDNGRVFSSLLADPQEARLTVGYLKNKHGDSFLDMGFGGDAPLMYRGKKGDDETSVTVRGLISSRFQFFSQSFDQLNADYIGGVALGRKWFDHSIELFLYHESSHLGDEMLERGERTRIDYSRETIRLLYSGNLDKALRIYCGPSINLNGKPADIRRKWTLQAGLERSFTLQNVPLYAALDLQSKEEVGWDLNLATQIGVYLGDPGKVHRQQRLFLELFNGFSNMGQFYDERELFVRLGIALDF